MNCEFFIAFFGCLTISDGDKAERTMNLDLENPGSESYSLASYLTLEK